MRIKFLSKTPVSRLAPLWQALIPEGSIDGVEFTFDPDDRDYDFLAVYEDLPPRDGEKKILRSERLACSPDQTVLIITEPSSIRLDGLAYLSQYGQVWTSRPFTQAQIRYLQKRNTRVLQKGLPLRWFYGRDMVKNDHWPFERIEASPAKTKGLSTVTSNKAMAHTVHAARLNFVKEMKRRLGDELALFGRGFAEVDNKAEAMTEFRYHLAIENHIQSGHYTEKLTDCFLAECLPFYFGDPDYQRNFPEDAVIPIDIFNVEASEAIIQSAIQSDQWAKRRRALKRAKQITLDKTNTLCAVADLARSIEKDRRALAPSPQSLIYGRHAFRRAHPILAVSDVIRSAAERRKPHCDPLQGYGPITRTAETPSETR